MKLTVHYFDEEIDSIPIAETDREVRTEGGVEQYRYVLPQRMAAQWATRSAKRCRRLSDEPTQAAGRCRRAEAVRLGRRLPRPGGRG